MTNSNKPHYTGDEETIRRNVEGSKELIEKRKHAADEGETEIPIVAAQQDQEREEPPGQWDIPIGGTSNPNFTGGTAKRHKSG